MGLYLIAMSACLVASVYTPFTLFLLALLVPGMPLLLYLQLRRMYREEPANRGFSAIWTAGIMITLCGSLICGLVTAAWLLTVQPDFMTLYMRQAIELAVQSGHQAQYGEEIAAMRAALDGGGVELSPMRFVFSMIWATVLAGSILSMLIAWLLRFRSLSVLNSKT